MGVGKGAEKQKRSSVIISFILTALIASLFSVQIGVVDLIPAIKLSYRAIAYRPARRPMMATDGIWGSWGAQGMVTA